MNTKWRSLKNVLLFVSFLETIGKVIKIVNKNSK